MILKGSQRSGAKQLGLHLLKTEENEHVELHDIRGFMSDDVVGALREAEAIAKGTKCRQFMFSVSLNPPENERVHVRTFEKALEAIEEKNGLTGQPRVVVFHEKEGRALSCGMEPDRPRDDDRQADVVLQEQAAGGIAPALC